MKRICALLAALCLSFCLLPTALAAYDGVYVYDPDGILVETNAEAMETQAAELVNAYDCGIYLFITEDLTLYGYDDIFELAQDYYEENLLGCGEGRDGILLALSTETRDAGLAVYGDWANTVFTEQSQESVWNAFLDDFGNDDWDRGCANYLSACEELLRGAWNSGATVPDLPPASPGYSAPVSRPTASIGRLLGKALVTSFLVAVIIAFIVCGVMKGKMKTARKASGAAAYVSGAVALKVREDHYTHSTVHRTPINRDNGSRPGGGHRSGGFSGGGSRNSRGFSGGSRKF